MTMNCNLSLSPLIQRLLEVSLTFKVMSNSSFEISGQQKKNAKKIYYLLKIGLPVSPSWIFCFILCDYSLVGRYFETMQMCCFSSYLHLLVLASNEHSGLQQLLLWSLPDGDSPSPPFPSFFHISWISTVRKSCLFSPTYLFKYVFMSICIRGYLSSSMGHNPLLSLFILLLK